MIERKGDELDLYIFTCPICLDEHQFIHDEVSGIYIIRYLSKITVVYDKSDTVWRRVLDFDRHVLLDEKRINTILLLK